MNPRQYYKNIYKALYQDIIALESSCMGLTLEGVMQQFIVDNENQSDELLTMMRNLSSAELKAGVLLHDMSGIGLYMLAYVIANAWADETILQQYESVIVVPIEWMQMKNDLMNIWDERDANLSVTDPQKTLIIVSGCSAPELRSNERSKENKTALEWIDKIENSGFDYIVVSNSAHVPYLKKQPPVIKPIALQPMNLTVRYQCEDKQKEVSLPGKVILNVAATATERNYAHRDRMDAHVDYTPNWSVQLMDAMIGKRMRVDKSTVKPEHLYPALKPQKTIQVILDHIENRAPDVLQPDGVVTFTTPVTWYSAAVTTLVEAESKNMACYRVGNYLIVRKLGNQYLACIDLADNTAVKLPEKLKTKYAENEVKQLTQSLQTLMAEPDFDTLQTDAIIHRLDKIASAQRQKKQGLLNKSSENALKVVKDHLRKDDPAQTRFNSLFARGKNDLAYHSIQQQVNDELQNIVNPTEHVRQIISGQRDIVEKNLINGLAATFLSETSRYRLNFITTLCLLDLIEGSNNESALWRIFFAHRNHTHDGHPRTIREALLSDMVHILGGLQVMSQGNSYNQVKEGVAKPKVGLHWVDFKAHLVLACWLSKIIRCEKDVHPHLYAAVTSEVRGTVVEDMLQGFNKFGQANPHIYDRLSRRLDSFSFMLIERLPLRNILSGNYDELSKYLTTFQCAPFYRVMLPDMPGVVDSQQNKSSWTMAGRFYMGVSLQSNGKEKISALSFEDGKHKESELSIDLYRMGLLNSLLEVDPLFYAVHYYLAALYMLDLHEANKSYYHIMQYFKHAKPSDGDIFYSAKHILMKCQLALKMTSKFYIEAENYFQNYYDPANEDYWLTYLLRATASHEYKIGSAKCIEKDLQLFFQNVAYRDWEIYHAAINVLLEIIPEIYQRGFDSSSKFRESLRVMANKLTEHKCQLYIHKDGFFSPSRYARKKQPHGPFSDYLCIEDSPAVKITKEFSDQVSGLHHK